MAILSHESSFQKWVLSPQEAISGSILTLSQKQCIQNQIAALAEEKINLTIDPLNPLQHVQREAELRGQITALRYLIDLSSSSEEHLKNFSSVDDSNS